MGKIFADKVDLGEMKGYMCKTTLANYGNGGDTWTKEMFASIVFSAKDYKPHVILSVRYNGVTQHFGTDAKKAINYYNSL
jgi:hypothetical protein